MSLGTSNRDGGKTSESGHLRALGKTVVGDILEGLGVSQRAAGANMSVDVAIGDALIRRSDGSYSHPVFNDAVYNQVISAADGSNPRRDIVVMYVDYGQAPSTAVSNNTNGVVKIKVVNGTPAGSPVDPNAAAIQASVGAGNPYTILARVRVPAGQTSISNTLIDDLRTFATPNMLPATKNGFFNGGWLDVAETWAFSSWNSTTKVGVFTVPSDATLKYSVGMFIRISQTTGGTKYGRILSITSTTVTVWMPGYTLNNEAVLTAFFTISAHAVGLPITIAEGNPYKASVYRAGTYAVSSNVKVQHDIRDYDDLLEWDPTTNFRFTAQVSGYYDVSCQVGLGSAGMGSTEWGLAFLFKNGSEIRRSMQMNGQGDASRTIRLPITDQLYLAAGDYLEHYGQVNGSRDHTGGRNVTWFTIKLASRG